jgi:isopentenyl phosphate kinase
MSKGAAITRDSANLSNKVIQELLANGVTAVVPVGSMHFSERMESFDSYTVVSGELIHIPTKLLPVCSLRRFFIS